MAAAGRRPDTVKLRRQGEFRDDMFELTIVAQSFYPNSIHGMSAAWLAGPGGLASWPAASFHVSLWACVPRTHTRTYAHGRAGNHRHCAC